MAFPAAARNIVTWLESKINYTFTDKGIAWEALQLAGNGTTYIENRDVPDGNKRLAIVGDIAIYMVLSVPVFASQREGYTSNDTLGMVGHNLGLANVGILQQNPRNYEMMSAAMRATAVEATVGAVYLDCQADMAVVERVLGVMGIGG